MATPVRTGPPSGMTNSSGTRDIAMAASNRDSSRQIHLADDGRVRQYAMARDLAVARNGAIREGTKRRVCNGPHRDPRRIGTCRVHLESSFQPECNSEKVSTRSHPCHAKRRGLAHTPSVEKRHQLRINCCESHHLPNRSDPGAATRWRRETLSVPHFGGPRHQRPSDPK